MRGSTSSISHFSTPLRWVGYLNSSQLWAKNPHSRMVYHPGGGACEPHPSDEQLSPEMLGLFNWRTLLSEQLWRRDGRCRGLR
jgi:hypothetical protein